MCLVIGATAPVHGVDPLGDSLLATPTIRSSNFFIACLREIASLI